VESSEIKKIKHEMNHIAEDWIGHQCRECGVWFFSIKPLSSTDSICQDCGKARAVREGTAGSEPSPPANNLDANERQIERNLARDRRKP